MSYKVLLSAFLRLVEGLPAVSRRTRRWLAPLLLSSLAAAAVADDTDAWLPGGARDGVYLHVVMDTGDTAQDPMLCRFGVDCGPPFMSAAAYRHLAAMYDDGAPVTAPGVFRAVLAAVMERSQFDDVRLALLISNHHDNRLRPDAAARGGGTVLAGYRQLRAHRAGLLALLESLPSVAAPAAHALQPKETYFEWLRYIRGDDVVSGRNTTGNFGSSNPSPDYDAGIINDARYLAPIENRNACPTMLSILFSTTAPTRDDDLDAEIATQVPVPAPASFTEFLAYLQDPASDLLPQLTATVPLTATWIVTRRGLDVAAAGQPAGGSAVMYVDDPLQLEDDLRRSLAAFVGVRSVARNAVFVEDVFHRGRILDDVFLPMFAPQAGAAWPGNLKKLKLRRTGGQRGNTVGTADELAQLLDARGQTALELSGAGKGRLRTDALTYWTDARSLPAGDGEVVLDGADGAVVTRGGAGQKIDGLVAYHADPGGPVRYFIGDSNSDPVVDGYPARQVFYEPEAGQALLPFNADGPTIAALKPLLDPQDTLTAAETLQLLRWARGQDVRAAGSTADPVAPARARDWLLGEVLNSQPLALNYGATPGYSSANPNIRVMFGSGDGALHSVQNTDAQGRESGREVFAFYPRASMVTMRAQFDTDTGSTAHRYGIDGTPVVLRKDRNGDGTLDHTAGDEAIVFFGLGRGGTSYFALDVSDPDAVPRLLWTLSPTVGGTFDELGMTMSTPLLGRVDYNGVPQDVLVFAGGYHGGWNTERTARVGKDVGADDDAVGNAIYIVDAYTGELVWKAVRGRTGALSNTQYAHAGLVDSIPSAVAALQTPAGILHRLYVGDSGGAVWRVDLPPAAVPDPDHRRNHWFVTKLADLGRDGGEPGGSAREDRRFFHAPEIVQSYDAVGEFDGVVIQSGNAADPNLTGVDDALFYLKDRNTTSGSAVVQAENDTANPPGRYRIEDLEDQTHCTVAEAEQGEGQSDDSCSAQTFPNGWVMHFSELGEKGLSSPLIDAGRILASTFVPGNATACPVQAGHGRLHVLRLADATAAANQQRVYELGEGITEGAKRIGDLLYLPGGGADIYDLDGDGSRDASNLLPSLAIKRYRMYWREPGVDPL